VKPEEDFGPDELGEDQKADFEELMGKDLADILREGQKALFARLVSACRAGTASHQEMAILRNILRDNGLTLGIPPEKPAEQPIIDLPQYGEPEYLQ
jgi:hypothetical protein